MDRRYFFKTILFTPVFTPLFQTLQSTKKDLALFLISNSPHRFTPLILQGLEKFGLISGSNFTFLNSHPEGEKLKRALSQRGWGYVPKFLNADISLSFSLLNQQASPSFTLIKGGRIWDIRSKELSLLWEKMNRFHPPSSWLTAVLFKQKQASLYPGTSASIYIDGHKFETVSLKKNFLKSYRMKRGEITIAVENGNARVLKSSCRHKICLATSPAARARERIICAPNHFLLEIQGSHSIDTIIG